MGESARRSNRERDRRPTARRRRSSTSPSRQRATLILGAVLVLGVSACTDGGGEDPTTTPTGTLPGPDLSADASDDDLVDRDSQADGAASTDSDAALPDGDATVDPDLAGDLDATVNPDGSNLDDAIHVAVAGTSTASGTEADPVDSVASALAIRTADELVVVHAGSYDEQLLVDTDEGGREGAPLRIVGAQGEAPPVFDAGGTRSQPILVLGEHVVLDGLEATGSTNQCLVLRGSGIVARNMRVHDCVSHGVLLDGTDLVFEHSEVFDSVLENEGAPGGGWGSGVKVQVGGERVTIRRNLVYENWGEGIAATRGIDVEIEGNYVVDNFSVGIYVDNSIGVLVDGNVATCTPETRFTRGGDLPVALAIGEEFYEGWGARLTDVQVSNNILAFCDRGIIVYEPEVPDGGPDGVSILHNTLWGSETTALSVPDIGGKTDVRIAGNLVHQADGARVFVENRAGVEMARNFWVGGALEDWQNGDGDGDLFGDPGLAGTPSRTSVVSFRIGMDGAARDGLAPEPGIDRDLDDVPREAPVTAGALEYVPAGTPSAFDDWFATLERP